MKTLLFIAFLLILYFLFFSPPLLKKEEEEVPEAVQPEPSTREQPDLETEFGLQGEEMPYNHPTSVETYYVRGRIDRVKKQKVEVQVFGTKSGMLRTVAYRVSDDLAVECEEMQGEVVVLEITEISNQSNQVLERIVTKLLPYRTTPRHTPDQEFESFIGLLREARGQFPELRIGQFFVNFATPGPHFASLYYANNSDLIWRLSEALQGVHEMPDDYAVGHVLRRQDPVTMRWQELNIETPYEYSHAQELTAYEKETASLRFCIDTDDLQGPHDRMPLKAWRVSVPNNYGDTLQVELAYAKTPRHARLLAFFVIGDLFHELVADGDGSLSLINVVHQEHLTPPGDPMGPGFIETDRATLRSAGILFGDDWECLHCGYDENSPDEDTCEECGQATGPAITPTEGRTQ